MSPVAEEMISISITSGLVRREAGFESFQPPREISC
jgi:hypothetical protein